MMPMREFVKQARRYPNLRLQDERAICNILALSKKPMDQHQIENAIREIVGRYPDEWRRFHTVIKHLKKRGLVKEKMYRRGWYAVRLYYHYAYPPEDRA